jgi:Domain of unknown function (DUF4359)
MQTVVALLAVESNQPSYMKYLPIVKFVGIVALAGLGAAMAIANPSQPQYEEYAIAHLTDYLKQNVCNQAPKNFGKVLRRQCKTLVDAKRPQLQQFVADNTDHYNLIFFSIYRTELSISPFLPSYQFQTLAVFQKFYTYQGPVL